MFTGQSVGNKLFWICYNSFLQLIKKHNTFFTVNDTSLLFTSNQYGLQRHAVPCRESRHVLKTLKGFIHPCRYLTSSTVSSPKSQRQGFWNRQWYMQTNPPTATEKAALSSEGEKKTFKGLSGGDGGTLPAGGCLVLLTGIQNMTCSTGRNPPSAKDVWVMDYVYRLVLLFDELD